MTTKHLRNLETITEADLKERGITFVGQYASYHIAAQETRRYLLHQLEDGRYRVAFKYSADPKDDMDKETPWQDI